MRKSAVLVVTFFLSSFVSAQEAMQDQGGPDFSASQGTDLSDAEKLKNATDMLQKMSEIASNGINERESAKRERDIQKLNCVNEKLTAIKGLLKISEQAKIALEESIASKDAKAGEHEYAKIAIAYSKCQDFDVQLKGCSGEGRIYTGSTQVTPTVGSDLPMGDSVDFQTTGSFDSLPDPVVGTDSPVIPTPTLTPTF